MTRPTAMPHEPRPPCLDVDTAEEETHRWLRDRGVTDRETLWCATVTARATVWVAHLRLAHESDRAAEAWLSAAKLEVRVRLLRHQMAQPMPPGERAALIRQHNSIDYTHLPPDMTRPPVGWMETP